jgi:hypothetical protein
VRGTYGDECVLGAANRLDAIALLHFMKAMCEDGIASMNAQPILSWAINYSLIILIPM